MGVTGPINEVKLAIPNTSRQANKYNDPEKQRIPAIKHLWANLIHVRQMRLSKRPAWQIGNHKTAMRFLF